MPHRPNRLRPVAVLGLLILGAAAVVQPAGAQAPSWASADLLAAAKAEGGTLTVYGSMNEQEALPYYKVFEDATGIKVAYVRASDTALFSRIAIEHRARQRTWDLVVTTPVNRLPDEVLLQFDPPEAAKLIPQARGPNRRWYGVYSNYNSPAYNTNFVKKEQLPKTFEEFLDRKEWVGHVAIDKSDTEWLSAIFAHYGEQRGRKLAQDIATTLKPVLTDGHLLLARSVGAGEYWVAINNYTNLTLNVKLSGAPTDYWALDPVALIFGSVGINSQAPHPKAALLAANFVLSREAQTLLTEQGRLPTRPDVQTNPPGVTEVLHQKKVLPAVFSADEQKKWNNIFLEIFRPR
ncbi:MAG: iron(III) transport system substrate-binding protein [Alphaproteobacteria bacterium]|nr:iron(III) transport system substrate-binding protein [Alphaproteobacteria bacterium]